jgi:hypothetical protein
VTGVQTCALPIWNAVAAEFGEIVAKVLQMTIKVRDLSEIVQLNQQKGPQGETPSGPSLGRK